MFNWQKDEYGCWQAQMPNNVTLVAVPDRFAKGFPPMPARGTKWRAACNHWDEASRTLSRYGRDEYMNMQDSAKEAMRLAEEIYMSADPITGKVS